MGHGAKNFEVSNGGVFVTDPSSRGIHESIFLRLRRTPVLCPKPQSVLCTPETVTTDTLKPVP